MKNLLVRAGSILLLALLAFSCDWNEDSSYEKQVKADDEKILKYLADSIQAKKNAAGFYYQVLKANAEGQSLVKKNVVDFYYKVSLLGGAKLEEATVAGGAPARFKLLANAIVPEGLDVGISLMKVGEKYRFFIPSYLAYGSYYTADLPANSILMVEVEVVRSQSETAIETAQLDSIDHYVAVKYPTAVKYPSGLYYVDSIAGTGNKPYSGDRVVIDFTRRYLDNKLIKSVSGVSLYIGNNQAVPGLEEGLKQMRTGGHAVMIMPAGIGFNQSLCIIPEKARKDLLEDGLISSEVLPYSIVRYNVALKSVN